MALYLISGLSGSGKSTVGGILKQRGYHVVEADFKDGVSGWFDAKGEKVIDTPQQPYSSEWLASHRWLWDEEKINNLASSARDEPVFLCGGADNEADFYHLFKKVFGLFVNNEILARRLQHREPKRWRDDSAELTRILQWNKGFENFCKERNIDIIDSSTTPDSVADSILNNL